MAAIIGTPFVFGVREPLPASGFPAGKLRWRMRHDSVARARIRTPQGIREFIVKEQDGCWVPAHELGRNVTAPAVDWSRSYLAAGFCQGLARSDRFAFDEAERSLLAAAGQSLMKILQAVNTLPR